MPQERDDAYGLPPGSSRNELPAPSLPYTPADPRTFRPKIGLIGCGGISIQHLHAYRDAGYDVAVLCDHTESKAEEVRRKFYPRAAVCTDYREVLKRDDIEVVDLAAHPADRASMYGPAIEAGKHILSQKPFVTDLGKQSRALSGGPDCNIAHGDGSAEAYAEPAGRDKADRRDIVLGPKQLVAAAHQSMSLRPQSHALARGAIG